MSDIASDVQEPTQDQRQTIIDLRLRLISRDQRHLRSEFRASHAEIIKDVADVCKKVEALDKIIRGGNGRGLNTKVAILEKAVFTLLGAGITLALAYAQGLIHP